MLANRRSRDEDDLFCCCEYETELGERSHLLACLCDCQAVDDTFERLVTCRPVPPFFWSRISSTVMDRIRVPWFGGARRVEPDVLSAVVLLPTVLLLACQSWTVLLVTYSLLPVCLMLIHRRASKNKTRTKFFLSWTVTSLVVLLGVFQLEVVPYLEILYSENFFLMAAVTFACVCGYLVHSNPGYVGLAAAEIVKSSNAAASCSVDLGYGEGDACTVCQMVRPARCSHCHFCGHCVLRRDHHCVWLDTCVGERNHRAFILGLGGLVVALVYGANLTLTTVCRPKTLWGTFLVPDSCSEVYEDIHISLCFVSAVYALLVSVPVALMLLQQLWLVALNTTIYELRRHRIGIYSRGMWTNCKMFWCPESR
ncbi:unnamed protein product [Ixodes hexagonus]